MEIYHGIEYTNQDTGISYKGGTYMDKNGIGYNHVYGGTSGNLPLELPDSTKIDEYADVSWSFSQDFQISNWKLNIRDSWSCHSSNFVRSGSIR